MVGNLIESCDGLAVLFGKLVKPYQGAFCDHDDIGHPILVVSELFVIAVQTAVVRDNRFRFTTTVACKMRTVFFLDIGNGFEQQYFQRFGQKFGPVFKNERDLVRQGIGIDAGRFRQKREDVLPLVGTDHVLARLCSGEALLVSSDPGPEEIAMVLKQAKGKQVYFGMVSFLRILGSDPAVNRIPVMIDSSDFSVIRRAMEEIQGKCIINSISLKEGEEKFKEHAGNEFHSLPV